MSIICQLDYRSSQNWNLQFEGKKYPVLLNNADSEVHGANMGPTWVLSAPDGPHVGPMNLAIREVMIYKYNIGILSNHSNFIIIIHHHNIYYQRQGSLIYYIHTIQRSPSSMYHELLAIS